MNNTILWEEKNSTEVEKSCSNNSANVQNDTTKTIRKGSMESTWKDIGGIKHWLRKCPECGDEAYIKSSRLSRRTKRCYSCSLKFRRIGIHPKRGIYVPTKEELARNCPKCNCEITYTNKGNRNNAEKLKRLCKMCLAKSNRIYETPDNLKRNCPDCGILIQYTKGKDLSVRRHYWLRDVEENRSCKKCVRGGKLNGMSGTCRLGKDNPNFGKKWSMEQKSRMRKISSQKYIDRGYTFNNYNKNACKYLDRLSIERGWNLQHAENGGEIVINGYFLDAYDKVRNIVVEYDEPHHFFNGELRKKDVDRMEEIKQTIGCKFYRYDERTKTLNEYN